MTSTRLQTILDDVPKAQLQRFYLHWFPGTDLVSSRERLRVGLLGAMTDFRTVRERFDGLSRSQRAFISSLLLRGVPFSATVGEVRKERHGRSIEDYEVESLLKSLQEAGYIVRTARVGDDFEEVFSIPEELGEALKCTVSLEARSALEMLSRDATPGAKTNFDSRANGGGSGATSGIDLEERVASIEDSNLRAIVKAAVEDHAGIMSLSDCLEGNFLSADGEFGRNGSSVLDRAAWRRELETLQDDRERP